MLHREIALLNVRIPEVRNEDVNGLTSASSHQRRCQAIRIGYQWICVSEARPGEPFVYVGSMGYLEVGIREARADRVLGARPGMRVDLL